MLSQILEQEMTAPLDYHEMLDIISIIVYQQRYGFGIVDTLRGLDVDGFNLLMMLLIEQLILYGFRLMLSGFISHS